MTDIHAKLAKIEELRSALGDGPADAALDALRRELGAANVDAALAAQRQIHIDQRAEGGGAISGSPVTVVQGDMHNHPPAPSSAAEARVYALRAYLRALSATCRTVQMGDLDDKEALFSDTMRLDQVYVGLNVLRTVEEAEDQTAIDLARGRTRGARTRQLMALEALLRAPGRRLMLLGEPGSGKSTLVKYLALVLADANLRKLDPAERQTTPDPLDAIVEWDLGRPLPILIVLRDLAASLAGAPAEQNRLAAFEAFLGREPGKPAAAKVLLRALDEHRALVMFDGLDEVTDPAVLPQVVALIGAVARTYPSVPMLVTCRVRDYQHPQRKVPGFAEETLAPFNKEQIAQFVHAWYAELIATRRQSLGTPDQLIASIRERPALAELAPQPLLLTMMAIIHAGKNTLPAARALLYDECIRLLLLRWRKEPGQPDVLDALKLPQFGADDLMKMMAQLGFLAHDKQPADAGDRRSEGADLSREDVWQVLEQTFVRYVGRDEKRLHALIGTVLHELAGRNGLLVKRNSEPEQYTFPHRTFQEFLAGDHIRRNADYLRLALERAPLAHWQEALVLMVGYQARTGARLAAELDLIRNLLGRTPAEQVLAGELLLEIGSVGIAEYNPKEGARDGLWGQASRKLLNMARGAGPPAPPVLRARAGCVHGLLSCGPLAELTGGARPPLGDPRLPFLYVRWPAVLRSDVGAKMLTRYWCRVAAGEFWREAGDKGKLQRAPMLYSYAIGRYPITQAEFAQFIAAGGYKQPKWWTPKGWNWKIRNSELTKPVLWDDPGFNNPLQPVVGMSWYEAAAFCTWLTAQGHAQGWLAQEDLIRLPSWPEWERAARGSDQRRDPWGDALPTPEHANYRATGIGAPAPIGCFPLGAAECGVHDLASNVDEWTATAYGEKEANGVQKDFTQYENVIISWGNYSNSEEYLLCGAHNGGNPSSRIVYRGFRAVCSRARGF